VKRSLVLVLAAQCAIVAAVAAPRLAVRLTGTEYLLRVRPVDPIDPFRGAYVDLRYEGFEAPDLDGRVYVALRRDGDAWVGDQVSPHRPAAGPYVACEADSSLDCGIESWFASQRRARELETELADGGLARVRIGDSGRAVIVGLAG
jgi:uncharacterized membrane-anchored protein